MSLTDPEHGEVTQALLNLSREFRTQHDMVIESFDRKTRAEHALSKAKARAQLRAPTNDPATGRKFTVDDRTAWVLEQVEEEANELLEATILHQYQLERSWSRKSELSALQTLSSDRRAEMKL